MSLINLQNLTALNLGSFLGLATFMKAAACSSEYLVSLPESLVVQEVEKDLRVDLLQVAEAEHREGLQQRVLDVLLFLLDGQDHDQVVEADPLGLLVPVLQVLEALLDRLFRNVESNGHDAFLEITTLLRSLDHRIK